MMLRLVDDQGSVWVNPPHVLYVAPVEDGATLVMLVNGQGFVVANMMDEIAHAVTMHAGSPF